MKILCSAVRLDTCADLVARGYSDPFRRHSGDSLLLMAIEQGSGLQFVEGGDILRTFFRFQLRELPSVLQAMRVVIDQSSAHGISSQTGAIYEGNNILLVSTGPSRQI